MPQNRASEINGGDDEEEALRIAIAMSLGQDHSAKETTQEHPVVDLTEGDDEANLDIASSHRHTSSGQKEEAPQPSTQPAALGGLAALGLDRKKMEEERLARLKKRKASESIDVDQPRPTQRTKVKSPKARAAESSGEYHPTKKSSPSTTPVFPKGVVKKTWVRGYPRSGDDITIDEVLQKDQLELAVLSSFQWEDAWLLSKFNLTRTKLVLVAFAADEAQVWTTLGC